MGGESTNRNAVKALRIEAEVPPQADMPLEYEPGDAIQTEYFASDLEDNT